MAASQGKNWTGFDLGPTCVYYFAEDVPRSKVTSFPTVPACFKVIGNLRYLILLNTYIRKNINEQIFVNQN